jgi:tight adherence protein B
VAPVVYENGRRVPAVDLQNLGESNAIVVAVDRSQSMRGRPLEQAAAAAARFIRAKPQSDEVAVVTIASNAIAQTGFAEATIDADTALRTLSTDPRQGTALYDAIVLSASKLSLSGRPGRLLVVLTDGRDVGSVSTLDDAVRAVRRAGVIIDAIALGNADHAPLMRLTKASGGTLYVSPTAATLSSVYGRIAAEFNRLWQASYTTAARPGDTVSLAVGAKRTPGGAPTSVRIPGQGSTPYRSLIPQTYLRGTAGALLLSVTVGILFFLVIRRARAVPRSERIKLLVRAHTEQRKRTKSRDRAAPSGVSTLAASFDRRLRGVPQWQRFERYVERAGLPVSPPTLVLVGIGLAFVLALLAALAAASTVAILFLFLLGLLVPLIGVRVLAGRRIRAFEDQLPDLLATVAGSLRVGHGLKAALQTVADEGAPPASKELRRVLAEARLGRPLDEALISMCERLGSEDLLYVATAVEVQTQVGGSLAGVFATVAETVRQRQQHRRKVRALTSSGRATATVLAILPFGFAALIAVINPGYMLPFLRSGVGHLLIAGSIVSILIGALLLNRVVNIAE